MLPVTENAALRAAAVFVVCTLKVPTRIPIFLRKKLLYSFRKPIVIIGLKIGNIMNSAPLQYITKSLLVAPVYISKYDIIAGVCRKTRGQAV